MANNDSHGDKMKEGELRDHVDKTLRELESYVPFEGKVDFQVDLEPGMSVNFTCYQPYISEWDAEKGLPVVSSIPARLIKNRDCLKTEAVESKEAVKRVKGIPVWLKAVRDFFAIKKNKSLGDIKRNNSEADNSQETLDKHAKPSGRCQIYRSSQFESEK